MGRRCRKDNLSEIMLHENWYKADIQKRWVACNKTGADFKVCVEKKEEFRTFVSDPNKHFQFLYHVLHCENCREITKKMILAVE